MKRLPMEVDLVLGRRRRSWALAGKQIPKPGDLAGEQLQVVRRRAPAHDRRAQAEAGGQRPAGREDAALGREPAARLG